VRRSRKHKTVMLAGRRVLLVEDEYLLAKWMMDEFDRLGIETVGPVRSVARALELVAHSEHLDGAVLDINVSGDLVFPVADALRVRGVPFVFTTGYDRQAIPAQYRDVVFCPKPVNPTEVVHALFSQADGVS
jgi:CheY-like chemotaxis protein